MDRRAYLASIGMGAGTVLGGCTAIAPPSAGPSVSEMSTTYPALLTHHSVQSEPVEESSTGTVAFDDLSIDARREFVHSVVRGEYRTPQSILLRRDLHNEVVAFEDRRFAVGVGVTDFFEDPEYGPDGDPDWVEPIAVDAEVAENRFTLSLRNALDEPLPVHHLGEPSFGVLATVGESVAILDHEAYERNPFIEGSSVPSQERVSLDEHERLRLSPGDSLTSSYERPNALPEDGLIRCSVPVGDEGLEQFPYPVHVGISLRIDV